MLFNEYVFVWELLFYVVGDMLCYVKLVIFRVCKVIIICGFEIWLDINVDFISVFIVYLCEGDVVCLN